MRTNFRQEWCVEIWMLLDDSRFGWFAYCSCSSREQADDIAADLRELLAQLRAGIEAESRLDEQSESQAVGQSEGGCEPRRNPRLSGYGDRA